MCACLEACVVVRSCCRMTLAAARQSSQAQLWVASRQPASPHLAAGVQGHNAEVNDMCFADMSGRLITCSKDNTLRVWTTSTGACPCLWAAFSLHSTSGWQAHYVKPAAAALGAHMLADAAPCQHTSFRQSRQALR